MELDTKDILGRGATAIVFAGKWAGTPVAIKRMQILGQEDNGDKEEYIMKSLKNVDNVLQLLDVQEDESFKYKSKAGYVCHILMGFPLTIQVFNPGTLCCYC